MVWRAGDQTVRGCSIDSKFTVVYACGVSLTPHFLLYILLT